MTDAARGERAAARHLRRQGYRVLGRNVRNRFGEVDILAEAPDRRTVVIVEVKSAAVDHAAGAVNPPPEVHVDTRKQRHLTALAGQLVRQHGLTDRPVRFDVIGVDLPRGGSPVIRHHIAAFESHI